MPGWARHQARANGAGATFRSSQKAAYCATAVRAASLSRLLYAPFS